jgi:hypothetical protein
MFTSDAFACMLQVNKEEPESVEVPILLPHELVHCLHAAGPTQVPLASQCVRTRLQGFCVAESLQFGRSMTGFKSNKEFVDFWRQASEQTEWRNHPVLDDPNVEKERALLPLCCSFQHVSVMFQRKILRF